MSAADKEYADYLALLDKELKAAVKEENEAVLKLGVAYAQYADMPVHVKGYSHSIVTNALIAFQEARSKAAAIQVAIDFEMNRDDISK